MPASVSVSLLRILISSVQLVNRLCFLKNAVDFGKHTKVDDPELSRRTAAFKRSAVLQRSLEVVHRLPHRRHLRTAVQDAHAAGIFPAAVLKHMEVVCDKGNAARHAKWDRNSASWVQREKHDPWQSGSDLWRCASGDKRPDLVHEVNRTAIRLEALIPPTSSDLVTTSVEILSAVSYHGIATLYEPKGSDECIRHTHVFDLPVFSATPGLQILPRRCEDGVVQQPASDVSFKHITRSGASLAFTLCPEFDMNTNASYCHRLLRDHCTSDFLAAPGGSKDSVKMDADSGISTSTLEDMLNDEDFMKPEYFIGSYAIVRGLAGKAGYNGLLGEIRDFDHKRHRFSIKLAGIQHPVLIRPSNLHDIQTPSFAVCSVCKIGDPTAVYGVCPYCEAPETVRIQNLRRDDPNHYYFQSLQI